MRTNRRVATDVDSLSLVLHSEAMDMRRLHCLVVGGRGDLQVVHVRERDAIVGVLQYHLGTQLRVDAIELELFLARPPEANGRDWIIGHSVDAMALAHLDASQLRELGSKFFTQRNAMSPTALLHEYFPLQPSMYEGGQLAVHVLVCVPSTLLPSPSPPLSPIAIDGCVTQGKTQPSGLTALVETWKRARIDPIKCRGQNGRTTHTYASLVVLPQLIRSMEPGKRLWFTAAEDELELTEIYVPAAWRVLVDEITSWLQKPLDDGRATVAWWPTGKRVVVTGASRSGKSVFLIHLLINLTRSKNPLVCVVDIPGVTYALVNNKTGVVREGQRGRDFESELANASTIYLFDASALEPDAMPLGANDVDARCVIVKPQFFVPVSSKRTKTFVLPQWTNQDVRRCVKACFPEAIASDAIAQYHKWGGLPGRVFAVDTTPNEIELEQALRALTPAKVMRMIMTMASGSGWTSIASGPHAAVWKPLVVVANDAASDTYAHDGQVVFTSQYVCDRVMELPTMRTAAILQHEKPTHPRMWSQIRTSFAYLAQEEEEKTSESLLRLFPKSKSQRMASAWA